MAPGLSRAEAGGRPGDRGPVVAGEPRWCDARDHGLVRQWEVEQRAPVGERRVRRITADVEVMGAVDARQEGRRLDAGEPVAFVADEFPWSSATRVVADGDDRPDR